MRTFEEFVERSTRVRTPSALRSLLLLELNREGFENLFMASLARDRVEAVHWSLFPAGFIEAYYAQRLDRVDPLVPYSLRARRPFRWEEATQTATPEQVNFMQITGESGLRSGFVVPIHRPGYRCDVVSISRRHARDATDPARLPILQALCTQAWCRLQELTGKALQNPNAALTPRELEVLNWVKAGKTNTDIGEILGLSVGTIEYHLAHVFRKLGATNRISAVLIAIQIGVLFL